MRTLIKALLGIVAAIVLLAAVSGSDPKDCSKSTCTSQERLAWRDALEAKEAEKARGLGMTWQFHSK